MLNPQFSLDRLLYALSNLCTHGNPLFIQHTTCLSHVRLLPNLSFAYTFFSAQVYINIHAYTVNPV